MPAYPWLRVAGTVGLVTLVPFTGGWVAVAAISLDLGGPSPSHDAAGSVLPAGTPSKAMQTASPSVVLSRSSTPSLDPATRAGLRTPAGGYLAQMPTGTTAPAHTGQPRVRHRAERLAGVSGTPDVGGRHRRDTSEGSSTTPHRDDPQRTGDGQGSGSEDAGSPGSDADGGRGGSGHAYGRGRGQPNGNGYGHSGNAGSREDSGSGSADGSAGIAGENGAQGNGQHEAGQGSEHGNGHG